jgi:hypothetical protein
VLSDCVRGQLSNTERITWPVALFLNYQRSGYEPVDLYDNYPYDVVYYYLYLRAEYPAYLESLEQEKKREQEEEERRRRGM